MFQTLLLLRQTPVRHSPTVFAPGFMDLAGFLVQSLLSIFQGSLEKAQQRPCKDNSIYKQSIYHPGNHNELNQDLWKTILLHFRPQTLAFLGWVIHLLWRRFRGIQIISLIKSPIKSQVSNLKSNLKSQVSHLEVSSLQSQVSSLKSQVSSLKSNP